MLCLFFKVEVAGTIKKSEEGKLLWLEPKEAVGKMGYENAEIALDKFIEI